MVKKGISPGNVKVNNVRWENFTIFVITGKNYNSYYMEGFICNAGLSLSLW